MPHKNKDIETSGAQNSITCVNLKNNSPKVVHTQTPKRTPNSKVSVHNWPTTPWTWTIVQIV